MPKPVPASILFLSRHSPSGLSLLAAALWMGAIFFPKMDLLGAPAFKVLVFSEDHFPKALGRVPLPPRKLAEALAETGVPAEVVNAEQLGAEGGLSPETVAAVVFPYGNAFPQSAFGALQSYHRRGGAFVLTGVPFTHPCVQENGKWRDLGHRNHFAHSDQGMGTGGFASRGAREQAQMRVPESPLQLPKEWFVQTEARGQWLETPGLDPSDEVMPLLESVGEDGVPRPIAALVRHKCSLFSGARDVWLGYPALGKEETDRFLATQLILRGALWILREQGRLSDVAFGAALSRLGGQVPPKEFPSGLEVMETPRPWGNTFLPKSRQPARMLTAVPLQKLSTEERIALTCLQALTSREQPCIWQLRDAADRFWLEWHRQLGHVDGFEETNDLPALFKKHARVCRGAIVPDPDLYRGGLLAANIGACEDLILAPPELAKRLGLEVKIDLRGRFKTYEEGMRWIWSEYKGKLNQHLSDYMQPGRLAAGNFGYAYQWRAPMVWVAGPEDETFPGADRFAEKRFVAEMFAQMPSNVPVLGFPAAGEGVGMGEPPGVELASRYGKGLVCTDHINNLPITSGIPSQPLRQPEQPPAPTLERDKIYIALAVSDGDNQNAWWNFFRKYFEHPSHGSFPLAFGIGPAIHELQPALAQWYYEHAKPTTEFIADVSGGAYMQPDHWGEAYRERDRVLDTFLDWTAKMLPPLGLRSVRTVHGEDDILKRYAAKLPACHSLFADMGCYSGHRGLAQLTYKLPSGKPVFRAATTWRNFGNGFLGEIREQVGAQRPAFVNGFVHCWTFGPQEIADIVAQKDKDMIFVTPSQLAALYEEAGRITAPK